MDEIKSQFETLLGTFFNELLFADSAFELYVHLENKRVDRINELNLAPAFFQVVLNSLLSSTVISLARIYESEKRSPRNINFLLNYVERNINIFPQDEATLTEFRCDEKVDINLINKHRSLLEEHGETIKNLFVWRDKRFAHFDKKYFIESDKLGQEVPINLKQFRDLIKLAHTILNDYSIAYCGNNVSREATNLYDIDTILDILHEYRKEK